MVVHAAGASGPGGVRCAGERERMPDRRAVWRQKVVITDRDEGNSHTFYVDFGEYEDGRLGEVFITGHRMGTFVRGVLDSLARSVSVALQSGVPPSQVARSLAGLDYPPRGAVSAAGSAVTRCSSIADYLAQEIAANYGGDAPAPGLAGDGDGR